MAVLTPGQKLFVTTRLAVHDTPKLVQAAWKEAYPGQEPPKASNILNYDPTTAQGKNLGKDLREVFTSTRKKFLKEWQSIPIAQKAVRLRLLNDMAMSAIEKRNLTMAANLMEQAAKEAGEVYTNRLNHDVKGKLALDTGAITDGDLSRRLARFGIAATLPAGPGSTPGLSAPADGGGGG